jgi:predicted Zn-dependent peptidase
MTASRFTSAAAGIALLILVAGAAAADLKLDVATEQLENGLTVLTCVDTTVPTVSIQTFVNVGSRDEDRPGITGLAHVFEHMMFRGTERYPAYHDAVARFGAQNNAYTTEDYTCYFVNAAADFLEPILEIESDRIRNLRFTQELFRTELGPVKEERRAYVDDYPRGWLEVELYRLAFREHTYQHPVIGWEEDLEVNMTYEDGLEFKNRFYVPNNCVLVICGNFNRAHTINLVSRYYAGWQAAPPYEPEVQPEPAQDQERVRNYVWKDSQSSPLLMIGYHTGTDCSHLQRMAALQVINHVLFARSGRLTRLLDTKMSLVEAISAEVELKKDPGLFEITAKLVDEGDIEQVRDSILSQMSLLRDEAISPDELNRAGNNLRADMIYDLNRPAAVAGYLGFYKLVCGDWRILYQHYGVYETITVDAVQQAAAEVFADSNRTIVTLSPKPIPRSGASE